jgi:two-component system chemotaxis response regulator CheB
MLSFPSRVLIISSLAKSDAEITLQSLRLGALDFITKPINLSKDELDTLKEEVLIKIKEISNVDPSQIKYKSTMIQKNVRANRERAGLHINYQKIVVIGSSTGGPVALEDILMRIPSDFPYPILIAQHLPFHFTNSFSKNLGRVSNLYVKEFRHSEYIQGGMVYIAPGGFNLILKKDDKGIFGLLVPVRKEYGIVSPSVNQLFISAAEAKGKNVIACLLTGIGNDGTQGLLKIKEKGGITIAQDEESSMIYSMPAHAVRSGLVQHELSLGRIPDFLVAKAMYHS